MSWLSAEMLLDLSRSVAGAAVNWWLQSALLIAAGLAVGALCRNRGSAVQSGVYRTTLAAVIGAPLATWGLHRAGVSGWSVEMPAAWSLVDAAPLSGGAAVEKSSPAEESALDVAARAALNVSAEDATETIHPYPIDADVPAGRSVDVVMNAPPDAPAPLRPSLAAPAPLAQAPVEATPAVLTMHRFGAIAVAASAAWLFVSAVLVVRLAVAWQRLGRIRRHAAPADPEVQSACRELASQLRVAPPAVLRSPYLPSPCLTGLRRPAVLLPEAAGDLPVRDVLAHELAHLSRGDCHWNLARQLAGAVLFFQPLMWRLSRRIETTAEEVCDDFVVHLGGDRRDYAYRLCDIAELSLAPFAPAGVGIVSLRSMLSQRVARIMDTSRSLSTRVGGALLTVVLLGGLIGAFAAGLVGLSGAASAVTANENDGEENSSNGDEGATATDDDLITVRGQVLDPAGKPVPDADVHVLRWYWNFGDHAPLATTNADANGRFEISYRKSQFAENAGRPNQWRETYFASFVDGFGPGWASYDRLKPGEEAVIKLAVDDVPIEGRVIDLEGNPVAGATIEVGNVAEPKSGSLDGYVAAITSGQAISTAYAHIDESLPDSDVGSWPKVQTDADGRFRLTGFGRERRITLQVSGPTIVTDNINAATRVMEPIVHPAFDYEDADDTTQYGAQFEYTAAPSRAIEGVVRDAESGETLAGVEIWSLKFAGADISGITTVRTKSGADGYFRLEGMPKGEGNRVIVVPTGQPYFNAEFDVPNPAGTDPAPLDVELHRGVWVTGRVADKATGKPVSAHIHYITFPDNERAQGLKEFEYGRHGMGVQDMFRTDADGRYRVVALPGHGIIGVRTVLTPYPGGQGYHDIEGVEDRESFRKFNGVFSPTEKFPTAVKEIQVDKDAAENVCDFDLDPGGRMTIRAVDPEGKPLVGVQVTGVSEIDGNMERMDSAEFDLVSFRPGENRTVLLSHPDRRLGKSLRVTYDPASKEPLTIALEPLGVVMGRLVNDGEPVSGATLNFRVAGDNDYGRALRGGAQRARGRNTRQ